FASRPAPSAAYAPQGGSVALHSSGFVGSQMAPARAAAPKAEEAEQRRREALRLQAEEERKQDVEERRKEAEHRVAALEAGRGPAVPGAFPATFAEVTVVSAATGSGSIGSLVAGAASLAAEEVPELQERIVSVLERTSDAVDRVWTSASRKTIHLKP